MYGLQRREGSYQLVGANASNIQRASKEAPVVGAATSMRVFPSKYPRAAAFTTGAFFSAGYTVWSDGSGISLGARTPEGE